MNPVISFPKSKQTNILNEVKSVRKLWILTIDNERFRTKRFLIKKRRGTQLHIKELVNFFCDFGYFGSSIWIIYTEDFYTFYAYFNIWSNLFNRLMY